MLNISQQLQNPGMVVNSPQPQQPIFQKQQNTYAKRYSQAKPYNDAGMGNSISVDDRRPVAVNHSLWGKGNGNNGNSSKGSKT